MSRLSLARSPRNEPAALSEAGDAALQEVTAGLRSLHDHCLSELVAGLRSAVDGDLTVEVTPVTRPVTASSQSPVVTELTELFNAMLSQAQAALVGYNELREQLRTALGDRSSLGQLDEKLRSLSSVCLTGLGTGLAAVAQGDLTVDAQPVTTPVVAAAGGSLGSLADVFNVMLGQAQGGLASYNAM